MCGISGVFSTKQLDEEIVRRSVEVIRHRGPDDIGFARSSNCILGMARLSIIDVVSGKQPNFNESRDVLSVFNGEIYNFKTLQNELRNKGHKLLNESDSEIIPHLYEEYGVDFPKKIQGMFAIALFDEKNEKLILVRDRLGKKPLWYSAEKDYFVFCSEIKGLLEYGVSKEINDAVIPEYLEFGYINAPSSVFKSIEQVKPATVMVWEKNNLSESTYWRPEDVERSGFSWNDTVESAKSLLQESVRDRLISERPLGVFLSGGIDSSLVAALAKKEIGQIQTFSIGFSENEFDESPYARKVAELLGTSHHQETVTPNPEILVQEVAAVLDQPFADSSFLPTYILSKFARQNAVVVLNGDGGDEAFGGYDRYRINRYMSKIFHNFSMPEFLFPTTLFLEETRLSKLLRSVTKNNSFDRYIAMQRISGEKLLSELTLKNRIERKTKSTQDTASFDFDSSIRSMQLYDIKSYLPGDLLYKVDMASMANGLEVRSPFLDYRVIEFGLSLPDKYKVSLKENKLILRNILQEYLPRQIVDRPKKGFGIPRANWLRNELNDLVNDSLNSPGSFIGNYVDRQEVSYIIGEHSKGRDYGATIWALLMLELWAKRWLYQ